MPEINLLPDDLRGKEKKEISSTKKKSDSVDVAMSNPPVKETRASSLKDSKPSVLSRLFAQKSTSPLSQPKVKKKNKSYKADQSMHIPNTDDSDKSDLAFDLAKSDSGQKNKKSKRGNKKDRQKLSSRIKGAVLNLIKRGKAESSHLLSDALDVNLIPEDLIRYPEVELPKIYARNGSIIFSTILIILGGYLAITFYQLNVSRQIANLELDIASLDGQIDNFDSDRQNALRLQKRIGLVEGLLNRHVYWTEFFDLLEKYTIKDVYYSNFSMAGHDRLIISAVARDYTAVAQQLVAFESADDFIKTAEVEAAAAEIDPETGNLKGVSFNITLEFVPGIFFQPIK